MIRVTRPLRHEFEVQMLDRSLLIRGSLRLMLECRCVRCLKPFKRELKIESVDVPFATRRRRTGAGRQRLRGLDAQVREDMLLELPRHPLCKPDCRGLEKIKTGKVKKTGGKDELIPSAWSELDKLKL